MLVLVRGHHVIVPTSDRHIAKLAAFRLVYGRREASAEELEANTHVIVVESMDAAHVRFFLSLT
jgi:hypothetical protein